MVPLSATQTGPALDLGFLWRHKFKAFFAFLLVLGAACAYTVVAGKYFGSEARIFVRLGRESVALDPTAMATGHTITVQDSRDHEINSIIDLFKSRSIIEQVVDDLGPNRVLAQTENKTETDPRGVTAFETLNPFVSYSQRDDAIDKLTKKLSVKSQKRSNIISIYFEAKDPLLAQEVVDKLIAKAQISHVKVNRASGSEAFFHDQTATLRKELADLEDRLRNYKNKSGVGELLTQRQILMKRIGTMVEDLANTKIALTAAEAETKSRRESLAGLPETIVTDRTIGLPASANDGMREQLYTLQMRESELLAKFQPEHILVKQVQDQLAEAKQVLAKEGSTPKVSTGMNPAFEKMKDAMLENDAKNAALRERLVAVQKELTAAEAELRALNDDELEITEMERQVDMKTVAYRSYYVNSEQARIDQALATQSISNLNVFQPATYSLTPVKPRVLTNLLGGFAGGIFAAIAVALYAESRRTVA